MDSMADSVGGATRQKPVAGDIARSWRWMAVAVLGMACAACSTLTDRPPDPAVEQRLAEVRALAGPPVDTFWYERMSSYEPIGLSDLLVFTSPRQAWLLHLDGECRNMDFDPFLMLTSHSNRVTVMLDSVRVRHNPIPCEIKEIRPVNAATLRHVDRERKAAEPPPGDAAEPAK
jgi:hypothetical protein